MIPTIHAAAGQIRQGRLSPLELLDACLARIDRYEERVRAWVLVDRDGARKDAELRLRELKTGYCRGPLHGIPIGIKDLFDVFDWPTACGSRLWAQSIARRDATIVERLRRAGAVFVGKTVLTQYASFDPSPTRNPWNLDRTPGGSSSGSAAAVACGMCLAALASQTGGSITRPAGFCGVPGLKPTYGRVSLDGALPLAFSMDHPGPMARSTRDLALVLQVIAGPDCRDPACSDRPVPDYLSFMDAWSGPPRIGRVRGLFDDMAEPSVKKMMDEVCGEFRARGATVVDVALPAAFAEVNQRHRIVMAVESASYHKERLQQHPEDYQPKIKALMEEGLACPAPEYARCKEHQRQLAQEMLPCFQGVDILLAPSTTGPAPDLSTTGNPAFQAPWSYTGLPTVSLPSGRFADGLPLCFQLVGRHWAEAETLAAAEWCEKTLAIPDLEPPG